MVGVAASRLGSPEQRRRLRRLVYVVVVLAVAAPAVHGRDDFPLSTYPMYANARRAEVQVATARGVTVEGERRALSLAAVAATDDPLIAEAAVRDAIRAGRADTWCTQVAGRLDPADTDVVGIEVVTETVDGPAHLTDGEGLIDRQVHAGCAVDR